MRVPGGYNRHDGGSIVWSECQCGWKSRKRQAGRRAAVEVILAAPFNCPDCGAKVSDSTYLTDGNAKQFLEVAS